MDAVSLYIEHNRKRIGKSRYLISAEEGFDDVLIAFVSFTDAIMAISRRTNKHTLRRLAVGRISPHTCLSRIRRWESARCIPVATA